MKRLAVVVCVAAAMFVGAGTAGAEYRQPGPTLVLNPSSVAPGGIVVATIRQECVVGETIDYDIEPGGDSTAAICTNNAYIGRLTAPSRPGTYDVNAAGVGLTARATLTVTAALGSPEEPLPSTGPDHALSIALIGAVMFHRRCRAGRTGTVPAPARRVTLVARGGSLPTRRPGGW